jgi:hypothetical protein
VASARFRVVMRSHQYAVCRRAALDPGRRGTGV